jgi:hypothetical protein
MGFAEPMTVVDDFARLAPAFAAAFTDRLNDSPAIVLTLGVSWRVVRRATSWHTAGRTGTGR